MATKTNVVGNRVTIDDSDYNVSVAGANRYAVDDEFGGRLGYFMVRGRALDADDYGVSGAHPVAQIGRLWLAANTKTEEKSAPEIKVVCRIAIHDRPAKDDLDKAKAYHAWLKKQPGLKAAHLAYDAATGKAMSISVWETREHMNALKERSPPDGAAALKATSVEVLPVVGD